MLKKMMIILILTTPTYGATFDWSGTDQSGSAVSGVFTLNDAAPAAHDTGFSGVYDAITNITLNYNGDVFTQAMTAGYTLTVMHSPTLGDAVASWDIPTQTSLGKAADLSLQFGGGYGILNNYSVAEGVSKIDAMTNKTWGAEIWDSTAHDFKNAFGAITTFYREGYNYGPGQGPLDLIPSFTSSSGSCS